MSIARKEIPRKGKDAEGRAACGWPASPRGSGGFTAEELAELDFIFARGLLSRRWNCVSPKLNDRGYLYIVRGRHPLIDPEKVVPSTIWLGERGKRQPGGLSGEAGREANESIETSNATAPREQCED